MPRIAATAPSLPTRQYTRATMLQTNVSSFRFAPYSPSVSYDVGLKPSAPRVLVNLQAGYPNGKRARIRALNSEEAAFHSEGRPAVRGEGGGSVDHHNATARPTTTPAVKTATSAPVGLNRRTVSCLSSTPTEAKRAAASEQLGRRPTRPALGGSGHAACTVSIITPPLFPAWKAICASRTVILNVRFPVQSSLI